MSEVTMKIYYDVNTDNIKYPPALEFKINTEVICCKMIFHSDVNHTVKVWTTFVRNMRDGINDTIKYAACEDPVTIKTKMGVVNFTVCRDDHDERGYIDVFIPNKLCFTAFNEVISILTEWEANNDQTTHISKKGK